MVKELREKCESLYKAGFRTEAEMNMEMRFDIIHYNEVEVKN